MSSKTYYDILQVPENATMIEIRQSYKRLALLWHPDKNKSPDATKLFQELNTAYSVLSNPKLRQNYDYTINNIKTPSKMPPQYRNKPSNIQKRHMNIPEEFDLSGFWNK